MTLESDGNEDEDSEIMILRISNEFERNGWIDALNEHIRFAKNLDKVCWHQIVNCSILSIFLICDILG